MTFPADQEEFGGVCPYLGLADDADSHATFPTEAHRCYRLPNPTRIASTHQDTYCLAENHVNCPVYLGEGVPGATRQAAAAVPAGQPPRGRAPQTVRGPQGAAASAAGARPPRAPGSGPAGTQGSYQRPRKPRDAGSIGPRPRSGGVSMPVATIGLFALAVVVIGIAFLINNLVGGSSNNLSPQDQFATNQALTTKAGGAGTTPGSTTTPGAGKTTTGTAPAGTGTATGGSATVAGGAAANTYTVQSGDTCGAIATNNGISLAQLEQLNGLTDDTCSQLAVGQVLKLK